MFKSKDVTLTHTSYISELQQTSNKISRTTKLSTYLTHALLAVQYLLKGSDGLAILSLAGQ